MYRVCGNKNKGVDRNFKIVIFILVVQFYIAALFWGFLEPMRIKGIAPDGYFRFASLCIVFILLLGQFKTKYSYLLARERSLLISFFLFLSLLGTQFFIVDDKFLHFRGCTRYVLYFACVLLSFYSCFYYGEKSRDILVSVAVVLFFSVIIFYPYVIYKFGLPFSERLQTSARLAFLLGAGNEDAHFMASLFPFVLAKFDKRKFLTAGLIIFLFVALIYNGTRSAFLMSGITVLLYYTLVTKKKWLLIGLIGTLVAAFLLIILPFLYLKFENEMGIFFDFSDLLQGKFIGGNFSGRLSFIWLPTIEYTIKNSFWMGFGNSGWMEVGSKVALTNIFLRGWVVASPHNFFVWSFVNWGILGLMLLIYPMFKGVIYSWYTLKTSSTLNQKKVSVAIFCSWICFINWCMIANSNGVHGWTVLILLILLSIANKNYIREDVK